MTWLDITKFGHLACYLWIMWHGWVSYKVLRKRSWAYMGVGFTLLTLVRVVSAVRRVPTTTTDPWDISEILLAVLASIFIAAGFRLVCKEDNVLFEKMKKGLPAPLTSGGRSVEAWQVDIRKIVREEVRAALESFINLILTKETAIMSNKDTQNPETHNDESSTSTTNPTTANSGAGGGECDEEDGEGRGGVGSSPGKQQPPPGGGQGGGGG